MPRRAAIRTPRRQPRVSHDTPPSAAFARALERYRALHGAQHHFAAAGGLAQIDAPRAALVGLRSAFGRVASMLEHCPRGGERHTFGPDLEDELRRAAEVCGLPRLMTVIPIGAAVALGHGDGDVWAIVYPSGRPFWFTIPTGPGTPDVPLRDLCHARLHDVVHAWCVALDERLAELPAAPPAGGDCSHSPDFTSVVWFGARYSFSKGAQAEIVRELWGAWESGGHSVTSETLEVAVQGSDTSTGRFEVPKQFRRGTKKHPAWGRMIQPEVGVKGAYRLVQPA